MTEQHGEIDFNDIEEEQRRSTTTSRPRSRTMQIDKRPSAGHERPAHGWFKSSYSTGACTCVEVQISGDRVLLRDSKTATSDISDAAVRGQIVIESSLAEWTSFVAGLAGPEDEEGPTNPLRATVAVDGSVSVDRARSSAVLHFDVAEWTAFVAGARDGEFDPPRGNDTDR